MKDLISRIGRIGLENQQNVIERRRIIMLNMFSAVISLMIVLLTVINFLMGSYTHSLFIFSSLVLIAPVYYFTFKQHHQLSRIYFICITLLIINLLGYASMFNFGNRHNEIYFIGFSSIIIILLDGWKRKLFFLLSVIFSVIMYIVRWDHLGLMFSNDSLVSLINVTAAFITIYAATSLFKNDLVKSLEKLNESSVQLAKQQQLLMEEQNALAHNRQLLRSLLDNLPILIALMDLDGKYIIVNKKYQEVFNRDLREIEGKSSREILGDDLYEQRKPLMDRCLEGKESILNYNIELPSGKILYAYGKYLPLFDEEKNVKSVLVYVTDVSKLKEVEQELLELNATKDKLLSIISHDLKAPINALQGLIKYAHSIDVNELKKYMAQMKDQVDAVSFTLDNLLNWVTTQLKGFKVNQQRINLSEIANQIVKLYQPQIDNKNIKIEILNNEPVEITADQENISLVYRNLLSNAIKFTPEGGSITIASKMKADSVAVSIVDNGIGMSQDYVNTIMHDGKKNETRLGTGGEVGTGLGLAFCKDILALNNAKMEIKSKEGEGTEMRIIFQN